jgi:signal transduction histidine kinase
MLATARTPAWSHLELLLLGAGTVSALAALVMLRLGWRSAQASRLAHSIQRFACGDPDARAEESGPAELRAIARQFNSLAATLAERRRRQAAFLAGVAHDLRTPLCAIKTGIALAPPDAPLPAEAQLRTVLEMVRRQEMHLERMAGDLLDLTRAEAGHLDLQMGVHDAGDLLRRTVALLGGTPEAGRVELSVPDHRVELLCDPLRIEQVVSNLVGNALKYSSPGAVVRVALHQESQEIVLSVTDHGIGISDQDHGRLFEPFHRLDGTAASGAGLGLSVALRIVEAHAGRIEVLSAPRKGSTFRVHLPRGPFQPSRPQPQREVRLAAAASGA